MGYIFDALNKKLGDKPAEGSDLADESGVLDATDTSLSTTTLTQALAAGDPALEASQAPLRLADFNLGQLDPPRVDVADNPAALTGAARTQTNSEQDTISDEEQLDRAERGEATIAINHIGESQSWWRRIFGGAPRGRIDDRLVSLNSPASAVAEEYRSIRTSILARHESQRHLVHTITSATPQEGKTITCVNLGLSFAELRNRKTIIVECDLRLPTFSKLLSCDSTKPGLINYLRGEATLADVIQQIEGSPLSVIPAGGRVSDEAVQLLSSARMSRLIQSLRAKFDHVLIDTPPVLQLADAGILGSQSEEVLLVARMRRTPRTLVEQAVNTLASYNATVNGIIATDNPRSRGRGYGYKYGYRYGYGYGYGYTSDNTRRSRKQRKVA